MDDDGYPSYPWSWRSAVVYTLDWVSSVLDDTCDLTRGLAMQLAADVNYRIDQRNAHEQMTRELETIMEESE